MKRIICGREHRVTALWGDDFVVCKQTTNKSRPGDY
jgi:hypothetical protein